MFTGIYTLTAQSGMNNALFTDISDYTDEPANTFLERRIILTTTTGDILVPTGTTTAYIVWSYSAGNVLEVTCVGQDTVLSVEVQWVSSDPQPDSDYISTIIAGFTSYIDQGEYGIIQAMTAVPDIVNQADYLLSLSALQLELDSVEQAVYYQQQQYGQNALDRGTFLLNNQLKLF